MDDPDDNLEFTEWEDADDKFALRVDGDSMSGEHIVHGDYVIIQRQSHARTGQVVAVMGEDGDAQLQFWSEGMNIVGVLAGVVRKY